MLLVPHLPSFLHPTIPTVDRSVGRSVGIYRFVVGFCGNGLLTNHYFLAMHHLGMDARTILNGVTYAKALRLSNKARQSTSTGKLVTLLSNDAQRLPDMALSIHAVRSTTIFILAAISLLVNLLGVPALAGVLFLVSMIPVQGFLAAKQMGLQRVQMKHTESRVKVINEVMQVRGRFSFSFSHSLPAFAFCYFVLG